MNYRSHIGLDGLDLVVLLGQRKQVFGRPQFKAFKRGQTYFFSSKENLDLFLATPDRFLPQLDGHCAMTYALTGKMVLGLPSASNTVSGKFYFYANPIYAKICQFFPAILEYAEARFGKIETKKLAA